MTEYWKSNPRKFCDYCKCWFADNRPSIEFHEVGKKHKENVAKRLQEIGKKGKEDYENNLMVDDYMKQMEEAALKAYKADISSNPDMTGASFVSLAKEKNADIVLKGESIEPQKTESDWHEAKSKDGHSYYYHKDTKETRWETPPEGFVPIEEQKNSKKRKKAEKKKPSSNSSKKRQTTDSGEVGSSSSSKRPAASKSQDHDGGRRKEDSSQQAAAPSRSYSSWTTVEKPVMPDLQLPKVPGWEEDEECYVNYPKEAPHQFTQKTVTLSGTAAATSFKKRKNADVNKKNARMRNSDL